MMRLCSKCKQRPAVVFISDPAKQEGEPNGLCLVCAKEMGIKPINDMLSKMNISDEDIEQMSEQFMDIMGDNPEETFDLGTAPAFPFLNNLFGDIMPKKEEGNDKKDKENKKTDNPKRRKYIDQYCTNLTQRRKTAN